MKSQIENIQEYLEHISTDELKKFASEASISDVIMSWDILEDDQKLTLFLQLDTERKVYLINSLPNNEQEKLLKQLSEEHARLLFSEMEPDDIVDVIQSVSPEVRRSVWNSLDFESRRETEFLLRFDEDDAAGLMTPRYVAIRENITVYQAIQFIRRTITDVETVYYIYVVDQLKRLAGIVTLRQLLTAQDESRISDIMESKVVSVREETDQEEVARVMEDYDLIALPVLDHYSRLLGIITVDDVIDVIREEQTEDVYKMGAMSGETNRYMDTRIWGLVRKRIPWLIILLLAGTLTTNVLHNYEPLFLSAAFLTLFVPVITQTGGNSGTQSSTLMIRGLATGEIRFRDFFSILMRELLVGLIMGILLAFVILLRSHFLPPGIGVYQAVAVGTSLAFVVLFSTLVGALAPLVIHRLGFDPTVMAGPLMATVIDVIGLTIYFEISRIILTL
ncbi:MAG: magnesium transporter [Spirochaetales bacterium]|nr:magnesium transporter [Spirochaetales bacterium]MCF7937881.1 magnesium transporter [Spirochaetales bacterium]